MEIWDAYNRDCTRAGVDLIRGEPIPPGLYHMGSEVLVRHTDGSFLVMRRDLNKPNHPGWLEATAGGALQKGETPLEGVRRELFEETGILADQFEPIGCHIYDGGQWIVWNYLCVTDWNKNAIRLQEGETIDFRWMDEKEFLAFALSEEIIPGQHERVWETLRHIGLMEP